MIYICSLFLIISAYWIIEGFVKYGFMTNGLPDVGFFPILAGFMVFLLSLFSLIMAIRKTLSAKTEKTEKEAAEDDDQYGLVSFIPRKWIPLFALAYSIVLILVFYYIGTITAVFLTCFSWSFLVFKKTIVKSLIFSVSVAVVVYLVFVLWLNTPFPKGLLI